MKATWLVFGLLAIDAGEGYEAGNGFTSLVVAIKSPGSRNSPRRSLPRASRRANGPRTPFTRPRKSCKGFERSISWARMRPALYAQVLALPDPTTANVCTWNGWTAGRFKNASAELVGRKLVLEACATAPVAPSSCRANGSS